jgi:inosine-uridine nucleoside N-ribohydrolase
MEFDRLKKKQLAQRIRAYQEAIKPFVKAKTEIIESIPGSISLDSHNLMETHYDRRTQQALDALDESIRTIGRLILSAPNGSIALLYQNCPECHSVRVMRICSTVEGCQDCGKTWPVEEEKQSNEHAIPL